MTAHILHIALGPVQEFIAQARRTGDLWYGSHLISELGRTAARALTQGHAKLLIPHLDEHELVARTSPGQADGAPPAVPNKLYALVPAGIDPAALAAAVREAVTADLKDRAAHVRDAFGELLAPGIDAIWTEQVATFLDFAAAWTPYRDDLAQARQRVDEAAAARRQLRDFSPWQHHRPGAPKSSLDGARETVLPPARRDDPRRKALRRRLGILDAEELDAIGLLKRVGGSAGRDGEAEERFVPIINIALAPWLGFLAAQEPELLRGCREACRELRVQRVSFPAWTRDFPHEASILLPSRWSSLRAEQGYEQESPAWQAARSAVLALHEAAKPYDPYVVCLVADGDHMGRALEAITTPQALQDFSRQLSNFARGARSIVESHRGALVYAGGDDVLAFVPVADALACAAALRARFTEIMRAACPADAPLPTLSVGLGVGHYMESMGNLLELGRRAERLAKVGDGSVDLRDALAIIVHKRSGSERTWRMRWDQRPHERLADDLRWFQAGLSLRKIHELALTLARLPAPDALQPGDADEFCLLLGDEVRRSLSRATSSGGSTRLDLDALAQELLAPADDYAARRRRLAARIDQILIARAFHDATPASRRDAEVHP